MRASLRTRRRPAPAPTLLRNAFRPKLHALETRENPATFVVTNADDFGPGSLRQAIDDANLAAGADTINFAVGTGLFTINLTSELPAITESVKIDGTTQPGFAGTPIAVVNGGFALGVGLRITGADVSVRGLVVHQFTGDAIIITGGAKNVTIAGNYIGVDATGLNDLGNGTGIALFNDGTAGASNVTIGGTTLADRNVISGNNGQGIYAGGTTKLTIQGNIIGLDAAGNAKIGNDQRGIMLDAGTTDVLIGGPTAGARNIISGNGQSGVLNNNKTVSNVTVQGNYIGTDITGLLPRGNQFRGVWFDASNGNQILNNVIGDNKSDAIIMTGGASKNIVRGNFVGLGADGKTAVGNEAGGIFIDNSPLNVVGGPNAADRNIFGNNREGIVANGNSYTTTIQNNYVGTDVTGTVAHPNREEGVQINDSGKCQIIDNLIAGNQGVGLDITGGGSDFCVVQGNTVGLNVTRTAAMGNATGVQVRDGAEGTQFGGTTAAQRNVISGNTGNALNIQNISAPGFTVTKWLASEGGNDRFYVLTPGTFFATAEKAANTIGGHLVSVGDFTENQFLVDNFINAIGNTWIGLTDDPAFGGTEFGDTSNAPNRGEGFVWTDGTTTAPFLGGYANWNGGEPNNFGAGENYIEMTGGGGWNDNGDIVRRAVLEFPTQPDLTKLAAAFNLVNTFEGNYIGTDGTGQKVIANGGVGIQIANVVGGQAGGLTVRNNVIAGSGSDGIRATNNGGSTGIFQWAKADGGNDNYYLLGPSVTWRIGEATAQKFGGHIASVTSAAENEFIRSKVMPFAGGGVWIGFTDDDFFGGQEFGNTSGAGNRGEGWVWSDGSKAPYPVGGPLDGYMNWAGGEPNNAGNEDYAEIRTNGEWGDLNSNANRRVLMEFTTFPDASAVAAALGLNMEISNNKIGTDPTGTQLLGNKGTGILVDNSSGLRINGNVIGGSGGGGISLNNSGANRVQGNFVGTDVNGSVSLPNNGTGIGIAGGVGNVIGIDAANNVNDRNVIRNNAGTGVLLNPSSIPFTQWTTGVGANNNYYIITPPLLWGDAYTRAKDAGGYLVSIGSAEENAFVLGLRNQVGADIWIGLTDDPTFGGTEFGNTSGAANKGEGWVWADGKTPAPFPGNYTNWNGGEPNNFTDPGQPPYANGENFAQMVGGGGWNDNGNISLRTVMEFDSLPNFSKLADLFPAIPTLYNSMRGNVTGSNTGLGIDINGDGPTLNDAGDPDLGPNNLQNFPVITGATAGTTTNVVGTYNGIADTKLVLDFYATSVPDGTGYGEGGRYLGSTVVTTDSKGDAAFNVNIASKTSGGEGITATATDPFGNTSEFSLTKSTPVVPVRISSVVINDGTAQRSRVTGLTVTFDQEVLFDLGPAPVFQLKRSDGLIIPMSATESVVSGKTVVGLTFAGPALEAGSLPDGKYVLTALASQLGTLDGNGDGNVGDDFTTPSYGSPGPNAGTIFRLFGDGNGDGAVNFTDFLAFRTDFGKTGQVNNPFDVDNDGNVNFTDFLAFRTRFGTSTP